MNKTWAVLMLLILVIIKGKSLKKYSKSHGHVGVGHKKDWFRGRFSARVGSTEALFPPGISIFNLAENMVQLSQNWATLPDRFLLWRQRQGAIFLLLSASHSTQCFLPNGRVFTPVKGCIIQVNEIILNLHQLQIFASETRIIKPILKEKERQARRDAFISI